MLGVAMTSHDGRCLCGAIRYTARAEPIRVTYCHCRFCQRATGAAYLVEPIFQKNDFAITQGTPAAYSQPSAGSGKRVTIKFCSNCGTKLLFDFERFPEIYGVFAGTFDNPNWFARPAAISRHIFLDSAQRGTMIPSDVNTFQEHAMRNDGTPIEPVVFAEPRTM
jgi:hypothetical protein